MVWTISSNATLLSFMRSGWKEVDIRAAIRASDPFL